MKTFDQWLYLAQCSVRTTEQKHREIAAVCLHDEQSGGIAATWHASSTVHDNARCACRMCETGSY